MGFLDKDIELGYLNKNGLIGNRVKGNLSQPCLHYHVQLFLLCLDLLKAVTPSV